MNRPREHSKSVRHESVKESYDEAHESDGRYEEAMANMAVYHKHCQDPVIFRSLGDIRGKSLVDLACGEGFYTRRFRAECAAEPVLGIDLSPRAIAQAEAIERREPLGIEYQVGDVVELRLERRFDIATAIHLLHYLENGAEIESVLRAIHGLLNDGGHFVTMIANPDFDLNEHDPEDSKTKFGYYFSQAEPGNGGLLRFHPGGFPQGRELTFEFRRWERDFIDGIAADTGFTSEWHDPYINPAGLEKYGAGYFENYLANPQSKLVRLSKSK